MAETENVLRKRQSVTMKTAMNTYTGIDYHKRYSVACKVDAQGNKIQEAKIEANAPEAFAAYFARLEEPSEVVIEACWTGRRSTTYSKRRLE